MDVRNRHGAPKLTKTVSCLLTLLTTQPGRTTAPSNGRWEQRPGRAGRPGRGSGLAEAPGWQQSRGRSQSWPPAVSRGGLFPPCLSRLCRAMLAPGPRRPWRAQRQQGTEGAEGTCLCPARGPTMRSSHRKRRGPRRRPRRQYERRLVNYMTDQAIFKQVSLRLRYWVAAAELIDYPASLGTKCKQSGVKIGHTAFSLSCGFHVFRCCIRRQQ